MEEGGLPLIEDLIKFGDFSEEFGYKSTKEILLREKIDGIFSANEPITAGVFKAIKEVGYSDIKIASFDEPDIPFDLNLNIILIKQKRYEIGKYAAKLLLEKLEGKKKNENKEFKKILIPPEIIEIKKIVENKKGDENEKNKNLPGITKKGGE
jgi:DNA-binding LacI/PurR family transcriptional regulator